MIMKEGSLTIYVHASCSNVLHEDHDFQTWSMFLPK